MTSSSNFPVAAPIQMGLSVAPDAFVLEVNYNAGIPGVVSVTPSSGSGASQNFALQYADTAGASSLQIVYAWFATTFGTVTNSCLLSYQPALNRVSMDTNAGTAAMSATVGTANTLANSQCSVNMSSTTAVRNGNTLTLNLPMVFQNGYTGAKGTFLYAADLSGSSSGWQQLGTWTVPGASGVPSTVSVTPSSGSGASQNFALQYADTAGVSSLQIVYAWFATTFGTVTNTCALSYQPALNRVSMDTNAGTAAMSATVGTANTLANSQCSVNMSTPRRSGTGTR